MYVVTVDFRIQTAGMPAFVALIQENARDSLRKELGCHRFDVCTSSDVVNQVFLYEVYEDDAAFARHLTTEHFLRFEEASAELVLEKDVKTFSLL